MVRVAGERYIWGEEKGVARTRFRTESGVGGMWVVLAAVAASLLASFATLRLLRRYHPKITQKPISQLYFASTSQVKFAYHESGRASDPLVLVIHGFPDTAASFCHLLPSLAAQGYHAVAPYLPGYFPSSLASDDNYSLVAVSRSIVQLIAALGHDDAVIIGHDWGGYVAITAATMHPNVVRRIAVLCVPHMRAFTTLPLMQLFRSWYVFLFQTPIIPHWLLPAWNFVFIDLLYRTWSPGFSFSNSHMQHVKETLSRPGCARAAVKYYSGLRCLKSLQVLFSRCKAPALQLAGQLDGCMGVGVFTGAKLGFSGKYELIVSQGGHFPHIERAEELSQLLLDWLASNSN